MKTVPTTQMPAWLNIGQRVFYSDSIGRPIYGTVCEWWHNGDDLENVSKVAFIWESDPLEYDSKDAWWLLDGFIFPVTEQVADEEPQMIGLEGTDFEYQTA